MANLQAFGDYIFSIRNLTFARIMSFFPPQVVTILILSPQKTVVVIWNPEAAGASVLCLHGRTKEGFTLATSYVLTIQVDRKNLRISRRIDSHAFFGQKIKEWKIDINILWYF